MRHQTLEQRFWSKVNKCHDDECWEWMAYKTHQGYGRFTCNGRVVGAHRLSYLLAYGAIPTSLQVLHRCDNPSCVNPKHLFVGTNADNVKDKMDKGRFRPNIGEHSGRSKLKESDIPIIRELNSIGISLGKLSKHYGVTKQSIYAIVKRKTWQHVS